MRRTQDGFTLVELLIVIAILAMLSAVVVPTVVHGIALARRAMCASNLHALGTATRQYLVESQGWMFPIEEAGVDELGRPGKLWYFGFETDESRQRPEGQRTLEKSRARLYRYCGASESLEVCPGFRFDDPLYKPKFSKAWWSYGINASVSLLRRRNHVGGMGNLDHVILFADAAQVNFWQHPASPSRPMYEEWHLIAANKPLVHFRHSGQANVLTLNGAVHRAEPIPGSFDAWLPAAQIGRLRDTPSFYYWPE